MGNLSCLTQVLTKPYLVLTFSSITYPWNRMILWKFALSSTAFLDTKWTSTKPLHTLSHRKILPIGPLITQTGSRQFFHIHLIATGSTTHTATHAFQSLLSLIFTFFQRVSKCPFIVSWIKPSYFLYYILLQIMLHSFLWVLSLNHIVYPLHPLNGIQQCITFRMLMCHLYWKI